MKALRSIIQTFIAKINQFLRDQEVFSRYHDALDRGDLIVGKGTYGIPTVDFYKGNDVKVIIGNFTSISKDVVLITGGNHPSNWVSTYPFRARLGLANSFKDGMPATKGNITIGSDVWIGTGVTILSGVTIGDGAMIGTQAVVTKDIPPYAIAAGIPARVKRFRFDQEIIDQLLEIKWWEWDEKEILDNINLLSSDQIEAFLEKHHLRNS